MKARKILSKSVVILLVLTVLFTMSTMAYAQTDGDNQQDLFIGVWTESGLFDVIHDNVKGMTYKKSTNTLTLNNYNNSKAMLLISGSSSSFKICIKGKCSINTISSDNSLSFTGSGQLTINKNKYFETAISVSSNNPKAKVTFGKNLKLTAYRGTEKGSYPVYLYIMGKSPYTAKKAIVINGTRSSKNSFKKKSEKYTPSVGINITWDDGSSSGTNGYIVANNDNREYVLIRLVEFFDGLFPTTGEEGEYYAVCDVGDNVEEKTYEITTDDYVYCDKGFPDGYKIIERYSYSEMYITGSTLKTIPKK